MGSDHVAHGTMGPDTRSRDAQVLTGRCESSSQPRSRLRYYLSGIGLMGLASLLLRTQFVTLIQSSGVNEVLDWQVFLV